MNTPIKRPVGRPRKTPKPVVGTRDGLRRAAQKAQMQAKPQAPYTYPIRPPALMSGVVPAGQSAPVMALDSNPYQFAQSGLPGGGFPGFQYLAQLATRAEYRAFASTMSTELTREWIEFTSKQDDDDDTSDKIKALTAEFERLNVRAVIQAASEHDCYFGRGQIFISLRGHDTSAPLILDKRTVAKGSLERVTAVEAVWTTPSAYNALDPAAPDFYKPSSWWMLGQQVHASRLMTVVTRPMPDILKPAFNFAGMSLSQLAEPYVDNWLRTRQSVADLINNFSITVLSTAMDQILQGDDDGQDLFKRADLFTAMRSNKGLMVLDKEREEIGQVNTPLSGLHELQAQSQEHMCSVSRIPAMILTGISPSGLNASSEGEIRVFYDWVAAQQTAYWREPIKTIMQLAQLSLFGEIDPDIDFNFVPLYQMTPTEEADIRAKDGVTDVGYINAGVVDPSEVREKLAKDPASGYDGLDTSLIIVPPSEPDDTGGEQPGKSKPLEPALDSEFEENKHPRADNGQFGSGGGGAPSKSEFRSVGPKLDFDSIKSASLEDVSSGKVKNVKYDPNLGNEAEAGYNNGTIRVGDKFFALSPSQRDHVIRHEQAHYDAEDIGLSTSMDLANIGVFGELSGDGSVKNGPNGQFKPDECLAESLALYQTEPEFLQSQFPQAYDLAASYYRTGEIPKSMKAQIFEHAAAESEKAKIEGDKFDAAEKEIRSKLKASTDDAEKAKYQDQLRALLIDGVLPT